MNSIVTAKKTNSVVDKVVVLQSGPVWIAEHQDFYLKALREALGSLPEKDLLETIGRVQTGDYQLWHILEDADGAESGDDWKLHIVGFAVTRFTRGDDGQPIMVLSALWKMPNVSVTTNAWRAIANHAVTEARNAGCNAITTCIYHEHTKRLAESLGFEWEVIQMRRSV